MNFLGPSLPWAEQGVLVASATPTDVSFDAANEQLWVGCNDGTLASYRFPDLQVSQSADVARPQAQARLVSLTPSTAQVNSATRVCTKAATDDAEWSAVSGDIRISPVCGASGTFVTTGVGLRVYDAGGVLDAEVLVSALEATGAVAPGVSSAFGGRPFRAVLPIDAETADSLGQAVGATTQRVLVGGGLGAVLLLDSSRFFSSSGSGSVGRVRKEHVRAIASFPVAHAIDVLALSSSGAGESGGGPPGGVRALVAACRESGVVTLFDGQLRSPRPLHSFTPHAGGLASVTPLRSLLLTAGLTTAAAPGGSGDRLADQCVRVFDLRMLRPGAAVSVRPGLSSHRAAGPSFVSALPEDVSAQLTGAAVSPPLALFGTTDGRFFTCDVLAGSSALAPLATVDAATSAAQRTALLGETDYTLAGTPPPRVRITAAALAPSGLALLAADACGLVHVFAPSPLVPVSAAWGGGVRPTPLPAAVRIHAPEVRRRMERRVAVCACVPSIPALPSRPRSPGCPRQLRRGPPTLPPPPPLLLCLRTPLLH